MKASQHLSISQKQTHHRVCTLVSPVQNRRKLQFLLAVVFCASVMVSNAYAQWTPKNYLMKTDPKHAKPRYWKDPNVWVYTHEFAKRFAMLEKWATDELKGAQAIAYRIVFDRDETCGWFNDMASCRHDYSCVMDIYTKHDAGLPWEPGSLPMGVKARRAGKSAPFLSPQKRSDFPDWDQEKNKYDRKQDTLGIANRGILAGKPSKGKSYSMSSSGRLFVHEYVRNVFPDLDYLSISTSCLLYETPENVRLRLAQIGKSHDLRADVTTAYEIKIPYTFMLRMAEYMKMNYEGKSLWSDVKGN